MQNSLKKVFIIYDDREQARDQVSRIIGMRHFGDVIYRRKNLFETFRTTCLQAVNDEPVRIKTDQELNELRLKLDNASNPWSVLIVSSRSGIGNVSRFKALLKRLPYAEENIVDKTIAPKLVYFKNGHDLLHNWGHWNDRQFHFWQTPFTDYDTPEDLYLLDLSTIDDFLMFMSGTTEARHFNQMEIDQYIYTKRSTNKTKMLAEHQFFNLAPESLRPWLIEPFSFADEGDTASYKMMRYLLADTAVQWVHGAFSEAGFKRFIDKLLFFVSSRPTRKTSTQDSAHQASELLMKKVESRIEEFLALEEGAKINQTIAIMNPKLEIRTQFKRYQGLYDKYQKALQVPFQAIGHGDPCFSNILYDQEKQLLKLIDPKGAAREEDLWTHPIYDLAKISHSVMGDYDFINNGLFSVNMDSSGRLSLNIDCPPNQKLKDIFTQSLSGQAFNIKTVRLAEASLFLSMLPLHMDHANKVVAFILNADRILNFVES